MTLQTLINRATDCTLTDDNWQYILDVCDEISKDPETNSRAAIKHIKGRLATRDANILFRTLTLITAIAENCGSRSKQEIASNEFLQTYMLAKLSDKKVHKQVKLRIAEVLQHLRKSFEGDPSLRPIQDACKVLTSKYTQFCKAPPSKPAKTAIEWKEKEQEEQELERALKLSVQEYEREKNTKESTLVFEPSTNERSGRLDSGHSSRNDPQTISIANVKKVRALYDLISYEPDELSFKKGDIITVIESVYRDWWRGTMSNGKQGIFPLNYVTPLVRKSPEESAREAAIEERMLKTEQTKIEELLALLSSKSSLVNEDRVTELFNEVLPVKSSLAKAIEKYSLRKDELGSLHGRMNEANNYYNLLIDKVVNSRGEVRSSQILPYPSESSFRGAVLQEQSTSSGFGNQYSG
ncbi:hypothetical protein FDK38_004880 [Candidozyma auris]|nr:hypothetical protein FDK38_004880 [[Candida] auris]